MCFVFAILTNYFYRNDFLGGLVLPKVFISFSSKDEEKAKCIKNSIQKNNFECWFAPENILAGESYLSAIPKAISESDAFVLLLSYSSQNSFWVKNELEQAINKDIPLFPIMIEDCQITEEFGFCLSHIQIFRYDKNIYKSVEQFINKYKGKSESSAEVEHLVGDSNTNISHFTKGTLSKKINGQPKNDNTKIALIIGWIGAFFNLLLAFLVFPFTIIQTIAIFITILLFSINKYNTSSWIVSLVCSILSLAILNIISTIMLYKKCIVKDNS